MTHALEIHDLTKTYANGVHALKGIDLEVEEGDFFALLGPNGAGKSTTIGVITSLVKKTAGSVQVFGNDIDERPMAAKRHIGVVPQEFNFNLFEPVLEVVVNQAGYYGLERRLAEERARTYLEKLGLWEKRRSATRELSGGMKRRLMIARALVHEPRLLILDEPTAGVDIELRRSMWAFLREINARGTTIILTTHYLEEAESLCRNVAIIDAGEIIARGRMKELLTQLNRETLVLDLKAPLAAPPTLNGYTVHQNDPYTLEVEVERQQGLNRLFEALSAADVEVISMRNKANRLEELFLTLVENGGEAA